MRVDVTADHIARGKRGSCARCPVALAVLEFIKNVKPDSAPFVTVTQNGICVTDDRDVTRPVKAQQAENVTKFIHAYDNQREVKPFSFELDPLLLEF